MAPQQPKGCLTVSDAPTPENSEATGSGKLPITVRPLGVLLIGENQTSRKSRLAVLHSGHPRYVAVLVAIGSILLRVALFWG